MCATSRYPTRLYRWFTGGLHSTPSPLSIERVYSQDMDPDSLETPLVKKPESLGSVHDVSRQPEDSLRCFNFNRSMLGTGYLGRSKRHLETNSHLSVDGRRASNMSRSAESVSAPSPRGPRSSLSSKMDDDQWLPTDSGVPWSPWSSGRPMETNRSLGPRTDPTVHHPTAARRLFPSNMSSDHHLLSMDDVFDPEHSPTSMEMNRNLGGRKDHTVHHPTAARRLFPNNMSSDHHLLSMDDGFDPEHSPTSMEMNRNLGRRTNPTVHDSTAERRPFPNHMSWDHHLLSMDDVSDSEHSPTSMEMNRNLGRRTNPTVHDSTAERRPFPNHMSWDHHLLSMDDVSDSEHSPTSMEMNRNLGEGTNPTVHDSTAERRPFPNHKYSDLHWLPMDDVCDSEHSPTSMEMNRNFNHLDPRSPLSNHMSSDHDWLSTYSSQYGPRSMEMDRSLSGRKYPSVPGPKEARSALSTQMSIETHPQDCREARGVSFEKTADGYRLCPVPGCNRKVKKPGKHLEQFHKLGKQGSRVYLNDMKVKARDRYRPRSRAGRLVEQYKQCPICGFFVTRVPDHINRKHKNVLGSSGAADGGSQAQPDRDMSVLARKQIHVVDNQQGNCSGKDLQAAAEKGTGAGDQSDNVGQEFDETNVDYTLHMPNDEADTLHIDENASDTVCDVHSKTKYKVDKEVHSLLGVFKDWLSAPVGTSLASTTITNYVPACGKFIEYLGGTIESIRNYQKIGLPGGYIEEITKSKKKKARSVQKSLYGLARLMEYLQWCKHPVFTSQEASVAHHTVKNYAASLRKPVQYEKEERKLRAQEEVEALTPILANYHSTEHYQKAKDIFAKATRENSATNDELLDMRAYLITQLLKKNGHRTGVITNCLMSEYRKPTRVGATYQITVTKHKTGGGGGALLVLSMDLWKELNLYVSLQLASLGYENDDSYLFPTLKGTKMQSNNIIKSISRALNHKTSVNTIRQMHVVVADDSGASPQQMSSLAKHMCHSTKVQGEYYDVPNRQRIAERVSGEMDARLMKYKACI